MRRYGDFRYRAAVRRYGNGPPWPRSDAIGPYSGGVKADGRRSRSRQTDILNLITPPGLRLSGERA